MGNGRGTGPENKQRPKRSGVREPVTALRFLPRRQVFITFGGVLVAIFLSTLDQTVVATAMPTILADLGGFAHYTFVTTAYLVTSTVMIPITGRLTDLYGRKWFYTAGIGIFVVGSALSGLSQTLIQLILFRALQGIGAGIMIANAFAVIGDLFPPAERGKYQGFVGAVFGLSSIIGPTLGGFITDAISWHWIFYINVPLGLALIVLFVFYFPHVRPDSAAHRVDYRGAALLLLCTVPLLMGLSLGGVEYAWVSPEIIGMLVFSVVMGVLLYLAETRHPEPVLPLRYFTDRVVSVSLAVTFLTGFGMFGSIVFVPLFFQGVLGLSATASGSFLTPMMLGLVVGSFVTGQLMSRAGGRYRVLGLVGIAVMAVGMGLLVTLKPTTTYGTAVAYIVVMGLGLGVTFPLYTVVVQNVVPYNVMGVVVSAVPFTRFIGGSLGLAILGSLLSSHFASDFLAKLPAAVKSLVPADQLSTLAHNPQALVSTAAQEQLKAALSSLGAQGQTLFGEITQALKDALSSALAETFLISLVVTVAALVIQAFIKEVPLRKAHTDGSGPGAG